MYYPKVYVILINWNNLPDTEECLDLLLQQTYQEMKIVVVDNASLNNEAIIIKNKYRTVKVIMNKENLGFCGANNIAIEYAIKNNADYVLLLNNDTLVTSELVSTLIDEVQKLQLVGAVSPIILNTQDKIWFAGVSWNPYKALHEYKYSGQEYSSVRESYPYLTDYASGCCMLISTDVIKAVGLSSEQYFAFYDEPEWCARMSLFGLNSYVIPNICIYHKVSRSTHNIISTYLLHRNRLLWMSQHLEYRTRVKSCPYLLKELLWHFLNSLGVKTQNKNLYSQEYSKAVLLAWYSYLTGKYGKWPDSIDNLAAQSRVDGLPHSD